MNDYEKKLDRERRWYTEKTFKADHFLNSRLFYSPERNAFNYVFPKRRFADLVCKVARSSKLDSPRVLVAPIGTGDDLKYIRHLSDDISGIDISEEAVAKIEDNKVKTHVGDARDMNMFPTDHFDMVLAPLFFHHFVRFGFDDFLREMYRVLKPGGHFFSLEPNSLNPMCWLTRLMRKVVGNISGSVSDEAPFAPFRLSRAMKRCGFREVRIYGASFSHNRVPICLARIINVATFPLLRFPLTKYFAWMCLFCGKK